MIPFKAAVETIAIVEQTYDVSTVRYGNLKLWPIIRSLWCQQFSHPDKNFSNKAPDINYITNFQPSEQQLNSMKTVGNIDLLFYSGINTEYLERVEGSYFSPFIDSTTDLIENRYRCLKIELNSPKSQETLPRSKKTLFLEVTAFKQNNDFSKTLDNFSDLQKTLYEITKIKVNEKLVLDQAIHIIIWKNYFKRILSILSPKASFVVCYYTLHNMAFIWACKELDIPVTDIQHGAVGDYHGHYTGWTNIPEDGYELIPDFYWCWGKATYKNLLKWNHPDSRHHKPIVGGNPRLSRWIHKGDLIINDDMRQFYHQLEKCEKVILVCIGHLDIPDPPLPDPILQAMKNSPSNWIWLVRLHPYFKSDIHKKQINKIIKGYGITNYEIEHATEYPLFALLKRANYNVTCWPSTYYEALVFDVPTTVVNPNTLDVYKEDYQKGSLTYANSGNMLLKMVNEPPPIDICDVSEKMDTSLRSLENIMTTIINFDKTIKMSSNLDYDLEQYIDAMNDLGELFFEKGYLPAACKVFYDIIKIAPKNSVAYNNLGVLFWHKAENKNAINCLKQALKIDPTYSRAKLNYEKILNVSLP